MKTLLVLIAVVFASGCYMPSPKPTRVEKLAQTIALGAAESVSVNVAMGVGKLRIAGGAKELLDASFEYNIGDWKPELSYEVKDGQGQLVVEQPSRVVGATWPGNVRYEWDLRLSDSVPMELKVDVGVGKSELDLRGLDLKRLEVDAGVGEGTIDLSGSRPRDLQADIEGGVGKLTLILPRDVGTRVEVEGGIGHVKATDLRTEGDYYVNDAWGKSQTSLRVDVDGGIGEIRLELAGPLAD